jgi:hypothetical protein
MKKKNNTFFVFLVANTYTFCSVVCEDQQRQRQNGQRCDLDYVTGWWPF